MNEISRNTKPMGIMPWVWLGVALIYDISPIDIIPDLPIIGWIDDFFISTISILNFIQKLLGETNTRLANIFRLLKIIVIILAIIAILLLLLLGTAIIKLITG